MITRKAHTKTRTVGVRLSPAEQEKVIRLSLLTEHPGNMSEAIRMLIDKAPGVQIAAPVTNIQTVLQEPEE